MVDNPIEKPQPTIKDRIAKLEDRVTTLKSEFDENKENTQKAVSSFFTLISAVAYLTKIPVTLITRYIKEGKISKYREKLIQSLKDSEK